MGAVVLQLRSACGQGHQDDQLGKWSWRTIVKLLDFLLQLHLIWIP